MFEFLSQKTKVEWGHAKLGVEGDNGLNYLTSSHKESSEAGMTKLINGQLRHGYTAREFNHSHPRNTPIPSGIPGLTGETGDILWAKQASKIFGNNVKYNIFTPKDSKYISYGPKSTITDFGYGKMNCDNFADDFISSIVSTNIQKQLPIYLKEYKFRDTLFYSKLYNQLCFYQDTFQKVEKYFLFTVLDSIETYYYWDRYKESIQENQSNCRIYSITQMEHFLEICKGYFTIEDKVFFILMNNLYLFKKFFLPTNYRKKFYYVKSFLPIIGGYTAWHMILKENMNLQFVGYEFTE